MSQKFRFHVLGIPHTITNKDFVACAFTQKVWKFCKMMGERGHTVYHYGHELSDPPGAINVPVIDNEVWNRVYGTHDYKSKTFVYKLDDEAYQTFYDNVIKRIDERAQPNDFVLYSWGGSFCNLPVLNAFPQLFHVEPGIGYASGHFAPFKAFESYAVYHAYCGLKAVSNCYQNNYEVVIPNYFDSDDFEYSDQKEDYFLFLGRVYDGKGIHIAHQVCEYLGVKLKIAGQLLDGKVPDYIENSPYCEFVGYADAEKRKSLMKGAIGSFIPSQYVEPFAGVQVENMLSGTPIITTDWGAFAENNINGVTGYRCRTFDDFLQATLNIMDGKIKSEDCRKKGEEFLFDSVAPQFEKFFQDIMNIRTNRGWYTTSVKKIEWNNSTK